MIRITAEGNKAAVKTDCKSSGQFLNEIIVIVTSAAQLYSGGLGNQADYLDRLPELVELVKSSVQSSMCFSLGGNKDECN